MLCAVTVRQLKPGSYEQFRQVWEPENWLPHLRKAVVFRNEDNPDMVLTIGYFDADQDTMDAEVRDAPAVLAAEDRRLQRIAEFEERIILNGIFELAEEVLPPDER
jgi:hypothetical protein